MSSEPNLEAEGAFEEPGVEAASVEVPPPPAPVPEPSRVSYGEPPRPTGQLKTPGFAAVLSAAPGLGNIYNGLYFRGISFFLIFISLIVLAVNANEDTEFAFLGPSIAFFWFFNLFDAYRQATLINAGKGPDMGLSDSPKLGRATLFPGVVLLLMGTYGALDKFFDLDLSWVFEQWPFFLLAAGGFLVYNALRSDKPGRADF